MTTNLTIKNAKVTLTDNRLSGQTYQIKEYIKAYLAGTWDKNISSWIVDTEKVTALINAQAIQIDNSPVIVKVHSANGLCPRCHTYCYGDCTAS